MAEPKTDQDLELLLDYLRRSRGFDFTGYKRASLSRRVDKRMQAVGVDGYAELPRLPRGPPRRVHRLFNTILINVTGFFRDPEAWEYLRRRDPAAAARRQAGRRADPGLERRLRLRRGGVHAGDRAGRGAGRRAVPRAGEDLRHRRRRGGADPGPAGELRGQARSRRSRRSCCERYFERERRPATSSARTCAAR